MTLEGRESFKDDEVRMKYSWILEDRGPEEGSWKRILICDLDLDLNPGEMEFPGLDGLERRKRNNEDRWRERILDSWRPGETSLERVRFLEEKRSWSKNWK